MSAANSADVIADPSSWLNPPKLTAPEAAAIAAAELLASLTASWLSAAGDVPDPLFWHAPTIATIARLAIDETNIFLDNIVSLLYLFCLTLLTSTVTLSNAWAKIFSTLNSVRTDA